MKSQIIDILIQMIMMLNKDRTLTKGEVVNEYTINCAIIANKQNNSSDRSIGGKIPIQTKQSTSMPNM